MEYKRLTKRDYEFGIIALCNACPRKGTELCTAEETEGLCCIEEQQNRLAEVEDKIEQGQMIELPCKVGDTVYFVDKQNKIIEEFDIIGIEISITPYSDGSNNRIEIAEKGTGKRNFDYILFFGWIGNTVFFTREEAEKRLKELQNG